MSEPHIHPLECDCGLCQDWANAMKGVTNRCRRCKQAIDDHDWDGEKPICRKVAA